MEQKVVTIVGGTGFVGRYVVKLLASAGYTLRVIARNPDAALQLKTAGDVGQIVLQRGDLADPDSLAGKIDYSYAVINLVGVLFESGRQNFTNLHAQGAERLAQIARAAGVPRFIHMSALSVDKARTSKYARTKLLGEKAVLTAFPEATIIRPSVIFGPEDNFFNQFARLATFAPALPLIGGRTRFQPVYVGDVAKAIHACLARPETRGQVYELGGPQTYSFRQLLEYVLQVTGRKRALLPVPFGIASAVGTGAELLPHPPLTRDQVKLLKYDNVVSPGAKTFANLGISPTALEVVVPDYLARFNSHKMAA